jgi:hypothetical protein
MMRKKKQEVPAKDAEPRKLHSWEVELVRSIEDGIL